MKKLSELTLVELALLSKEIIPDGKLFLEKEPIPMCVDDEILHLFSASDEVSEYYKDRLMTCIRFICQSQVKI